MNPGDDKREFGPDILRALAIVLVVFAHSLIYLDHIPFVHKYSLHIVLSCAVWGVEVFFVLSGYLIGRILIKLFLGYPHNIGSNLLIFFERRWLRTIPLYFIALGVYSILFGRAGDPAILYYTTFTQNLFWPMILKGFFGVSWSLTIEEWFYVLFPLFLWVGLSVFPKNRTSILVCVFALILFCSVLRGLRSYEDLDQEIRTVAYLRLDAIAFGMIAIFLNWKSPLAKAAVLAGTLGLFLLSELIVLSGMVEKGDGLLASPFFARDILFLSAPLTGCLVLSLIKHVKTPKSHVKTIITFLSKISYPLYLFHFIIAWTLQITDLDHNIEFVLFWTFSILASYLIHKGVEMPIMAVRRQFAY